MPLLGRLLKNRRSGDAHAAWNLPALQAPELFTLTSRDFADGATMPREACAKNIGGDNLSPHLAWSPPPSGTAQLLLVVEDVDVPVAKPIVHCAALLDPAADHLEPGALAATPQPAPGVRILRASIGRGYHGPGPIKGHGPHRYVFQLFALATPVADAPAPESVRPRALLAALNAPVLARARLTGVYER